MTPVRGTCSCRVQAAPAAADEPLEPDDDEPLEPDDDEPLEPDDDELDDEPLEPDVDELDDEPDVLAALVDALSDELSELACGACGLLLVEL